MTAKAPLQLLDRVQLVGTDKAGKEFRGAGSGVGCLGMMGLAVVRLEWVGLSPLFCTLEPKPAPISPCPTLPPSAAEGPTDKGHFVAMLYGKAGAGGAWRRVRDVPPLPSHTHRARAMARTSTAAAEGQKLAGSGTTTKFTESTAASVRYSWPGAGMYMLWIMPSLNELPSQV